MGGGGLVVGGGGVGLVILLVALFFGVDPNELAQVAGPQQSGGLRQPAGPRSDDDLATFSRQVLASTEDVWGELAPGYRAPVLVLYDGFTDAGACGQGQSAMGPFYCPPDQKLYIDLSFYRDLAQRFGVGGDFAQAYVIAHEIGHHVQKLTGVSDQARRAQGRAGRAQANAISVRVELQADCYAGVWGHHAQRQGLLEAGDLAEALTAAEAIGDDRLQQAGQGRVVPETFTHGSAAQRREWFEKGFATGDPAACDTGL